MKPPEKRRTEDSGVFDQTTGKWMMRVAANPQAGQYVFDGGRYTFAAADEGHARHFVGDPLPAMTGRARRRLLRYGAAAVAYLPIPLAYWAGTMRDARWTGLALFFLAALLAPFCRGFANAMERDST